MAVAKKDQERTSYAWMYGVQAAKTARSEQCPISGRSLPTRG